MINVEMSLLKIKYSIDIKSDKIYILYVFLMLINISNKPIQLIFQINNSKKNQSKSYFLFLLLY